MPGYILRHGAWSPGGDSIVFQGGQDGGQELYEVDALGGTPELLISRQPLKGASGQRGGVSLGSQPHFPHFLPSEAGSRVLLYTSSSGNESTLMVEDLETGSREALGPGVNGVYSPSGHIIYQPTNQTEELWALPFSLDTLKVTGKPFLIAHNARKPTVSDDGTLVYHDPRLLRQLVWRDRDGGEKTGEIGFPQDRARDLALSPDGRSLAVTVRRPSGNEVWVWDLDRDVPYPVNPGSGGLARCPVWSPSGKELAFTAQPRPGACDIVLRQADGSGEEETLIATSDCEWVTDWSRDGKYILYELHSQGQQGVDLWYLEKKDDGTWEPHPYLTGEFRERAGKFSRNGRYVAYLSNEVGIVEVYVERFPEGGDKRKVSSNIGREPLWSWDGKELFFSNGTTLMATRVSTAPNFSFETPESLFDVPLSERGLWMAQYDVSPDGQRFVLSQRAGNVEPTVEVVQNWFAEFKDREPN